MPNQVIKNIECNGKTHFIQYLFIKKNYIVYHVHVYNNLFLIHNLTAVILITT